MSRTSHALGLVLALGCSAAATDPSEQTASAVGRQSSALEKKLLAVVDPIYVIKSGETSTLAPNHELVAYRSIVQIPAIAVAQLHRASQNLRFEIERREIAGPPGMQVSGVPVDWFSHLNMATLSGRLGLLGAGSLLSAHVLPNESAQRGAYTQMLVDTLKSQAKTKESEAKGPTPWETADLRGFSLLLLSRPDTDVHELRAQLARRIAAQMLASVHGITPEDSPKLIDPFVEHSQLIAVPDLLSDPRLVVRAADAAPEANALDVARAPLAGVVLVPPGFELPSLEQVANLGQ